MLRRAQVADHSAGSVGNGAARRACAGTSRRIVLLARVKESCGSRRAGRWADYHFTKQTRQCRRSRVRRGAVEVNKK